MKIALVHALPEISSAFGQDRDGFSAAVEIVAQQHEVDWVNVHPANADWRVQRQRISSADFVLVRSDWGWYPDAAAARTLALTGRPCGLVVAGSHPPPSIAEAKRYDVLFYETPWYRRFVQGMPWAMEAIGVDARHMKNLGLHRDIDWLMVGRLAAFKRPLELLSRRGVLVAVGDMATADESIVRRLRERGVQVIDHVPQSELARLYNRSRNVLVPCELQGGGERAVLEARACGCNVEVAPDNPKLESLVEGPVPSHVEYAARLMEGVERVMEGQAHSHPEKVFGEAKRLAKVGAGKVRRSPSTLALRTRALARRLVR